MDKTENSIIKQMTDQAEEICFVFNIKENYFQYVNDAFEKVTRRKSDELTKNPKLLLKIIHKEDLHSIKNEMRYLLKKKTCSLLNFRILRPDKTERWIRLKVYPIIADDKIQYLTGIGEDDSARKASIFTMQKVTGWKDSTLEILSHDLRGPIGTVKMLASLIARKLPNNPDVHKLTEMIEGISTRNLMLIQALLKREALDSAGVEMSKERLDVVWEVHQAMDIYIKSQKQLHKKISYTHSHDKIFAEIDSMKFLQIINNLVSNAIKFTKENGKIKVHIEKLEKTFLITVADNGIGIPKRLQPVLFKKYTKAGREGLEGEESVGLGMWIIKSLTEAHKGTVWFESEATKGTTFYVEIPLGLWKITI